jgi:uncharacterized protein (TIGR02145 family)
MSSEPISSNSNMTFTLDPVDNLTVGTTYKTRVKKRVKDTAGNAMSSRYDTSSGFTPADLTAPTVTSVSTTADNQSSVSITDNITVTFSEAMDTTYVTTNTDNTSCSGTLGVSSDNFSSCVQMSSAPASSNDNMTFTLDPSGNLTGGTTYKTRVTTGVKDTAGNAMSSQYETSSGFTTAGLVDIDGNTYRTVVIGTQHWMAENLKVTKYRNGDNITHIPLTTNSDWNSDTDGAYGYYDDNTTLRDTYGMLYNWYAVDNSSGLCPEGWQVPTSAEFTVLYDYLENIDSKVGGQLKETGTDHWQIEYSGTSNSSGFTGLPAGNRDYNYGTYWDLGNNTFFWTSDSHNFSNAKYRILYYNSSTLFLLSNNRKQYGFSVRCLED